jgi:hypothetical protein
MFIFFLKEKLLQTSIDIFSVTNAKSSGNCTVHILVHIGNYNKTTVGRKKKFLGEKILGR